MPDRHKKISLKDQIIRLLFHVNMPISEDTVADVLEAKGESVRRTLHELRERGTVAKSTTEKLWYFRNEKPTK